MAFTEQEENTLKQLASDFNNAKQITDLPTAVSGEIEQGYSEVVTPAGESKKFNIFQAMHSKRIACRRWNETLATPVGEAWGDIDFLRALPGVLGLGCYLVADDRSKRKLDPNDHYKFADGSPALLDGSMGQYMWCWEPHWFCTKREGNYLYEAVALERLPGWECYYIPAGGTSALGFGVVDRTTNKLCSLISMDTRYRGGSNHVDWDGTYRTLLGKPATGMSGRDFSIRARNRGLGWEAGWYVSRAVQEYLFRLIMGTRNCQAPFNSEKDANGLYQGGLGVGTTLMNYTAWYEKFVFQPIIPCAAGVELADSVGVANYAVKGENEEVLYNAEIPVFLGLKHPFGHLWYIVRGLIIDTDPAANGKSRAYVAPSMYDYEPSAAGDATVEGMLLAAEIARATGYIKKYSTYRLCCLPTELGGTNGTYYCDAFYANPELYFGLRCRLAGGRANHGADAGAFNANAFNAVAASGAGLSAPLCFFTEDPLM
jgi:hypothetical protein